MPLVVLSITDGFHVPLIPFGEVVLSAGAVVPLQNASEVAKSGMTLSVTVTINVTGVAHWFAAGVNS